MFPYIIIILFSTIMSFFAQMSKDRSPVLYCFFALLVIVPPSLMAAFRDLTVGIDIKVYEDWCFNCCVRSSSLWEAYSVAKLDFLFVSINYFSSLISPNIHVAFFFIEFFFLLFFMMAASRFHRVVPMWLVMFATFCCLYNLSFNLMRQCLAISVMTWAFSFFIIDGSLKKFLLASVLAFGFHKTCIVPVFAMVAISFVLSRKNQVAWMLIFAFCTIGSVFAFKVVLESIPIFEHYLAYATNKAWTPIVIKPLVLADVISVFLIFVSYRFRIKDHRFLVIYSMLVVTDLAGQFLGIYTLFATRIAMYTCALQVIMLLHIFCAESVSRKTAVLMKIMTVCVYLCYGRYFIFDTGNTIPYKSEIVDIDIFDL